MRPHHVPGDRSFLVRLDLFKTLRIHLQVLVDIGLCDRLRFGCDNFGQLCLVQGHQGLDTGPLDLQFLELVHKVRVEPLEPCLQSDDRDVNLALERVCNRIAGLDLRQYAGAVDGIAVDFGENFGQLGTNRIQRKQRSFLGRGGPAPGCRQCKDSGGKTFDREAIADHF